MTSQKSSPRPTAKPKSNSEAGLYLSVFRLASLPYSSFICFTAHLHHRFRELANLRYSPPSSLCSSPQQRIDLSKNRLPKNAHTQLSTNLYDSILTTTDGHLKQLEILYTANYRYPFFYYLSLLSLSIRKRKSVKPLI